VRQIYLGALAKMRRRAYQLHLFASDRLDLLGNLLSPEDIQIAQAERQRIAEEHRQAEERNKQRQAAWDALSEEDKQARLHPPPAWKCTGCSAYNYQDLRGLEFVVCGHCGLRHRVEPR
jgi:hypothetical protein